MKNKKSNKKRDIVYPREGTRAGAAEANLAMEALEWYRSYSLKYSQIEAQGDGTQENCIVE